MFSFTFVHVHTVCAFVCVCECARVCECASNENAHRCVLKLPSFGFVKVCRHLLRLFFLVIFFSFLIFYEFFFSLTTIFGRLLDGRSVCLRNLLDLRPRFAQRRRWLEHAGQCIRVRQSLVLDRLNRIWHQSLHDECHSRGKWEKNQG